MFRISAPKNLLPMIETDFHRFGSAASNLCIRGPAPLPLLRLVTNFKNYFTARVASRHLFLRLHRFRKRECLSRLQFSLRAVDGAGAPSRRRAAVRGGRLHLLRLGFSMKGADPFSALLNPNASAVVRAGYVLAVGSRLQLRLVGHDSHFRMREDHLHV